jgi:short-chain Z-isoprenyl diphosphate synthase
MSSEIIDSRHGAGDFGDGHINAARPLAESIKQADKPRHLAVILDGNRRWAKRHSMSDVEAYRLGAERAVELAANCHLEGIEFLTLWALSKDNLNRPSDTVDSLLQIIAAGLRDIAGSGCWHIHPIGELALLPAAIRDTLLELDRQTASTAATLNIAMAYSGRDDMIEAISGLIREHPSCHGTPEEIGRTIAQRLSTAAQPEVDLVIRTSGERRLSGFMPWQAADAELYFTSTDWPDFTYQHLMAALEDYRRRDRRHGL